MALKLAEPRNLISVLCGKRECEVRLRVDQPDSEIQKRLFMKKLAAIGETPDRDKPFSVRQIFYSNDDTSLGFGYEAYYTRYK